MEPNNVIMGDTTSVDLPQMDMDEDALVEEKKMAKYSKTGEFKRIKKHCQERIAFYQTHLPDGRDFNTISSGAELVHQWKVANSIIGEFKLLMNMYEVANEVVEKTEYER